MKPNLAVLITVVLLILFVLAETVLIKEVFGEKAMPFSMVVGFIAGFYALNVTRWIEKKLKRS
jgi:uncharacterized membrane protein YjdF